MNVKRGFVRLWLVLSALWVASTFAFFALSNGTLIPSQAFVMPNATSGFFKLENLFDQFDASFKANHRAVEFPNSVTLFVVNSVPDSVVREKAADFYKIYSEPRSVEMWSARLDYWAKVSLGAFAPPFLVLVIGALVGWIIAGFAAN